MRQLAVRGLAVALSVAIVGAGMAQASAPGNKPSESSKKKSTTVTEVQTEAELAGVVGGAQVAAKGHAESTVITVTNTATNTSTTNSFLSVGVKGLTLADGAIVTFNLNGTSLGTGTVKKGRASITLSTKKGATVPVVNSGDTVTVVDPDGTTVDLTGTFGTAETETENS